MSPDKAQTAFAVLALAAWAMFVVTLTHDHGQLAAALFVLALAVSLGAWSSLRWGVQTVHPGGGR